MTKTQVVKPTTSNNTPKTTRTPLTTHREKNIRGGLPMKTGTRAGMYPSGDC